MMELEQENTKNILNRLEEMGYPFPQFAFYKVKDQLQIMGSGSFSVVFEMMEKEHPNRHYAMKVMGFEGHVVDSAAFWNAFRIQRILCDDSPNVVRVLSARELELKLDRQGQVQEVRDAKEERWNTEGLILQFVLMEKLECIVRKDKFGNIVLQDLPLHTQEEVLSFAEQIGQAVRLAHENHVLHRDIKLENIFWDKREKCYKLGDFGIAKYAENGNAETVVYTDGYGAPEIECRLDDHYGATADIYSLGISLYLLLNELRFPGSEGYRVNIIQYNSRFIFPAPVYASENVTRLIRKMCSYYSKDRYQTMDEVLAAIELVKKTETVTGESIDFSENETETYREEQREKEENGSGESPMTRAGRKQLEREEREQYQISSRRYFFLFTVLFVLLWKGLQKNHSFLMDWHFWIFLLIVLVEGELQKMREFHFVFGIFTVVIGMFSMGAVGVTVPHIFLLSCLLFHVPVLTIAGALGTGIWMLLELTGKLPWLSGIADYSWVILVILLMALHGVLKLQIDYGMTTGFRARMGIFLYDKLALAMIASGIILLVLQQTGRILIPEVIRQMHLIRTGGIAFVFYILCIAWQGDEAETEVTA